MRRVASLWDRTAGHLWTVVPTARDLVLPPRSAASTIAAIPIVDEVFGPTTLACELVAPAGARDLVILVHGLGGSRRSAYVQRAALALQRLGFATMALDLRGADRGGGGFYHVALADDLVAACRSPAAAPFERVFVIGFSMGGHVAVHFAALDAEPRLAGVAGLCTPLHLGAAQRHVDAPARGFYRRYVLRGLQEIYAAVAARHDVPTPARDVWRCRTIHDWDRLTITKRYGEPNPEAFYERHAAHRRLHALTVETILVLAASDPIVPPELAVPFVAAAPAGRLRVRVLPRGGHLQFPRGQDLGLGSGGLSVVEQIGRHWLAARGETAKVGR